MSEEMPSYQEKGLGADDLSEYLRAKDPDMREKAYAWKTAGISGMRS